MRSRYQLGKHWNGTRVSAAMVATFLDANAETAIDIGCNEGALTIVLAKSGIQAVGIEKGSRGRETAVLLAHQMGINVPFQDRQLTIDDLETMEKVDVALLLSVHHQIVASMGLEYANRFLRALARKVNVQLFFQPASILRKYKKPMPFEDNDMHEITRYFLDLLADIFEHRALIGFSPNDVPRREPLRPMLLFSHRPIEVQGGRNVIGLIEEINRARRVTHPLVRGFFLRRAKSQLAFPAEQN